MLAVTCGIIVWRFQSILSISPRRASATMRAIVQAAQQSNPFSLGSASGSLQSLQQRATHELDLGDELASQIDSTAGYPLAKTANLGSSSIPPITGLSSKHDAGVPRTSQSTDVPSSCGPVLLKQGRRERDRARRASRSTRCNRDVAPARDAIVIVLAGVAAVP